MSAIDHLHQETNVLEVRRHLRLTYKPSVILNQKPPPIHKSETTLPRRTRRTLVQLRSGYSIHLRTYKHRIDPETSPLWPRCLSQQQTTQRLFTCPANPTRLTPWDLWKKPTETVKFLALPTFNEEDCMHIPSMWWPLQQQLDWLYSALWGRGYIASAYWTNISFMKSDCIFCFSDQYKKCHQECNFLRRHCKGGCHSDR